MARILSKGSELFINMTRKLPSHLRAHSLALSLRPYQVNKTLDSSYSPCSVCGTVNVGFRNVHLTHINSRKRALKKPVFYNKKSQRKLVSLWKNMSVQDLADATDKTVGQVFEAFSFVQGSEAYRKPSSIISNIEVGQQTVRLFGMRFTLILAESNSVDLAYKNALPNSPASPEDLEPRPPVITIMGHVDHGKTTLLDTLRKSSIVDTEFGGITQHIGAFEVFLPSGEQVTFLDTPGHAAFSAMRERGANVTDLIVLVVAAEDGVLPQTEESITLAKQSNTPIIVAINKIDKPEANVKRCKTMILNAGLQLEEQGGEVQAVEISALKGTNVPLLVEALATQAELLELKATKKGLVEGTIIESKMEPQRGKVATCIIERGVLTKGAVLVAETSWAKVRNLFDCTGKPIKKALPGTPTQIIGWRDSLPAAGAKMLEVEGERRARQVMSFRESERKNKKGLEDYEVIQKAADDCKEIYRKELEERRELGFRRRRFRGQPPREKLYKDDPRPRLSFVLKGDVDGSIEAILDVLDTYFSEECILDLLTYGVGSITPSDVEMAKSFKGCIYTFNVPVTREMQQLTRESGVRIYEHNIIYRLIETLKDEISKRLPPKPVEEIVGEATIQQMFIINEGKKKVPVAGCHCLKGELKKKFSFKVIRSMDVIHVGEIKSMKNFKKEVESIKKDSDCGIRFEDASIKFEPGDSIICYKINMVEQRTDWSPEGF